MNYGRNKPENKPCQVYNNPRGYKLLKMAHGFQNPWISSKISQIFHKISLAKISIYILFMDSMHQLTISARISARLYFEYLCIWNIYAYGKFMN